MNVLRFSDLKRRFPSFLDCRYPSFSDRHSLLPLGRLWDSALAHVSSAPSAARTQADPSSPSPVSRLGTAPDRTTQPG